MPPKKAAKKQPINRPKKTKNQGEKYELSAATIAKMRKVRPIVEASRRHGRSPTLGQLPEDMRWRVVDEYFHDTGLKFKGVKLHKSMTRIAKYHDIHFSTVKHWVESAAKNGHVDDAPRTGRPAKQATPAVVEFVHARLDQTDPAMRDSPVKHKKQLQAEIKRHCKKNLPLRTLTHVMRKADAVSKATTLEAGMTDAHKAARLEYARKYADKPVQWWLECAFGDGTPCVHTWFKRQLVLKGQPSQRRPRFNSDKFSKGHVWGAMCVHTNWRTPWIHPPIGLVKSKKTGAMIKTGAKDTMTQEKFTVITREHLIPAFQAGMFKRLVVDNSDVHDEGVALLEELGCEIVPHPPNSPALNPIENVIGMCKETYREDATCYDNTKEACVAKHQAIWKKFDMAKFRACVESMPRRLAEVIEAKGSYTHTHW
jgi:transposase